MEEESFIAAFDDVPTDLAGDYSQLYIFHAEDFGAWCRRVRDAHERAMADAELAAAPTEAQLEEWGYVELPKDADGVPIRVGDVLTDGEYTFVVGELAAFGDGSWSIRNEDGNAWAACDVTHHHEPTVEDVLREFAKGLGVPVADSYVAAAATKLRLAGEDE